MSAIDLLKDNSLFNRLRIRHKIIFKTRKMYEYLPFTRHDYIGVSATYNKRRKHELRFILKTQIFRFHNSTLSTNYFDWTMTALTKPKFLMEVYNY